MSKRSVVTLAVIVGVLSSLATIVVLSLVFRLNIFRFGMGGNSLSISEFSRVQSIIDDYYLYDYDLEEIQYAGLKSMVQALGDPYSVYYTPEEFDAYKQDASGEYYGLGMVIRFDEERSLAKVEYFFEDSAAEEAGVREGDYIISIDGQDVTKLTLQEISVLSMGEEGVPLRLGVLRGGETLEFKIVRKAVSRDMVTYRMLDDGVGYMRIVQFGGNCEELFIEGMEFFKEKDAKGVVIDLRNNPGGYLTAVVNVLDVLLPEGTLVYTEDKHGHKETLSSDKDSIDIPLAIVVNGNTASAAEIFAGAVQDFGYGEVVGTKTYGKGVVQVLVPIATTGGGLKITTSQYFTPKGRTINKNGIYPDHYVDLQSGFIEDPESYVFEQDAQIKKAMEVLKMNIGQ